MAEELEYKKVAETINDFANDNLSKLAQLFPAAVKDGEVDFEALKQELGDFNEVGSEKYELTWAGKQNAKKVALEDVNGKTLNYVPEDSKNPETTENLYIEGDNLEVLKLLRQNYYGAIKMIYIDPPYNTGNDFVYNDNFTMSVEESEIAEGNRDELGEKYKQNSKSQNRYHANWLNMMYPRLKVAKDLLTDDGVIFISIDDNEVYDLLPLMNEVFESKNVKTICVKMSEASGLKMAAVKKLGIIPKLKEYVIIAKKDGLKNLYLEPLLKEKWDAEYNIYLENFDRKRKDTIDVITEKDFITESDILVLDEIAKEIKLISLSKKIEELGLSEAEKEKWCFENSYRICQCVTSASILKLAEEKKKLCNENLFFVLSNKQEMAYLVRNNYSESSKKPRLQMIFAEDNLTQNPGDIWTDIKTTGLDNEGNVPFKNGKKPMKLINRLIQMAFGNTKQTLKNSIVMDFFSGSATTAETVLKYNQTTENEIKYIMVQISENLVENLSVVTGDEKKNINDTIEFLKEINRPHLLTEIGKERIRRAGDKIITDKPELADQLDIGFKVFKVADTNIKWNHQTEIDEQFTVDTAVYTPDLMDFMPGAKDEDIVYEVMLRQNDVPLSSTLETLSVIGQRTYLYASSYLVCLETEITVALVDKLAALNPLPFKFIFRDSAFQDDIALKDETFRRLKALIEKNAGTSKKTYTVEFI